MAAVLQDKECTGYWVPASAMPYTSFSTSVGSAAKWCSAKDPILFTNYFFEVLYICHCSLVQNPCLLAPHCHTFEVNFVPLDFNTHPESLLQKIPDNLSIVPPFWFLQYTHKSVLKFKLFSLLKKEAPEKLVQYTIKILIKILCRLKSFTEILPELLWNWNSKLLFHRKQTVYLEQVGLSGWDLRSMGAFANYFMKGEKNPHYWVTPTPALAMLAFQMQPMALGSISDSLSCKCQGPLQRLKELLSVLKTAYAPATVVVHEEV